MKKLFAFSMLMALTLVSAPAFADDQGVRTLDVTLTATMPHWINITAATEGTTTGITATANANNTDITATTAAAIEAAYTITSNVPAADAPKVAFTATAGGDDLAGNNALQFSGTTGAGKIAFANTRSGSVGTAEAVANAIDTSSAALYSNKNVILLAYNVTNETSTPDAATPTAGSMSTDLGDTSSTSQCNYSLKEGVNTLKFTVASATALEQLSLIDEPGDYKVKINLTASHT